MRKVPEDWKVEAALDALLAEAGGPPPDPAFIERVMADARAVAAARAHQPARPAAGRPERRRHRGGGWQRRLARLAVPVGGWRAVGALAACALIGFWLGLAAPAGMIMAEEDGAEDAIGLPLIGAEDLLAGLAPARDV
ncbi:MAG: hypothetical protein D6686_10040 [Alphaproteobacteria bacterium]|nr:MAG: hypothetical protein D6686_10040 [Alphaproteobacteria bacterium]